MSTHDVNLSSRRLRSGLIRPAGTLPPTCAIPLWATRSVGPLNEVSATYRQPDIVDAGQAIPFTEAALIDAKIIQAVRVP